MIPSVFKFHYKFTNTHILRFCRFLTCNITVNGKTNNQVLNIIVMFNH